MGPKKLLFGMFGAQKYWEIKVISDYHTLESTAIN